MSVKTALVAVVLLAVTLLSVFVAPAQTYSGDPFDAYGNCIYSSMTYTRSMPDRTLYLGDSFVITTSDSLGPITTMYSLSWSYDITVFMPYGGGAFRVIGNVSGTHSVSITATFTIVEVVGNSTITLNSSLSTSQFVETRAFV